MALSSSLPWLLRKSSSSSQILQRMKFLAAGDHWRSFTTCEGSRPTIVHKRSLDILHDPWFNKVPNRLSGPSCPPPFKWLFEFLVVWLDWVGCRFIWYSSGHGFLDDWEGPPGSSRTSSFKSYDIAAANRALQYAFSTHFSSFCDIVWSQFFSTLRVDSRIIHCCDWFIGLL